jgi:hypothetical protein
MPATSTAQRRMMAIAEHYPEQLYAQNRGVLKMSKGQLHDFASTKEKGKPHYAPSGEAMKHVVRSYSEKVRKKGK